jgi:transposase
LLKKKDLLIGPLDPLTDLFPPGKGGGAGVEYGYKGKGVLIHLVVDAQGMPLSFSITAANGDERQEAIKNIDKINVYSGKPGRPKKSPRKIAADKGYDSKALRSTLRQRGIKPEIPRRKYRDKPQLGRPLNKTISRYVVERTFSWFQRKFRRIAVRWERLPLCFETFLTLAIVTMWVQKMV